MSTIFYLSLEMDKLKTIVYRMQLNELIN
jgi:hypothetical protein